MNSTEKFTQQLSKPMEALNLLKQGVNQKDVAMHLGVSQATISNWYNQYLNCGIEAMMVQRKAGRRSSKSA